jgi:serine/threonine protein kinase
MPPATTQKMRAPKQKKEDPHTIITSMGWKVGKMLGEGAFGKVYLVTRQSDGVTAACKIIAKVRLVAMIWNAARRRASRLTRGV